MLVAAGRAVRSCLAIAVALVALAAVAPAAHAQAGPPYVFWDNVTGQTIGRATIDGATVNQSIVSGIQQINQIGVAADAQHLYWGNGAALMRSDLDGNGAEELVKMATAVEWLAVDNRFIYMAGIGRISRVNLDGTGYIENFIPSVGPSRALAVDSEHIYWINGSAAQFGAIARANLDGTGVNPAFIPGASAGNGVAVDGQHIYWSNGAAGTIGRANLDGSGVDSSFISGLWTQGTQSITGVKGLALDFEHLYWVNYYYCNYRVTPIVCGGGGIGRANLDGTGVQEEFAMSAATGLHNGCDTSPPVRCGPTTIAVSGPTQPACLQTTAPPQPPPGGAVFWRPPGAAGTSNTVILAPGTTWTPGGPCSGTAAGLPAGHVVADVDRGRAGGGGVAERQHARADVGLGRPDDRGRRAGAGAVSRPERLPDLEREPRDAAAAAAGLRAAARAACSLTIRRSLRSHRIRTSPTTGT